MRIAQGKRSAALGYYPPGRQTGFHEDAHVAEQGRRRQRQARLRVYGIQRGALGKRALTLEVEQAP
jgi:hypothetical protein